MACVPMSLNDLEGYFICMQHFYILYFLKCIMCWLEYIYTQIGKYTWSII